MPGEEGLQMDRVITRLTFGACVSRRAGTLLARAMHADTVIADGLAMIAEKADGRLHTTEVISLRPIGGASRRKSPACFELRADDAGFRRTVLALRVHGLPYRIEVRHALPPHGDARHNLLDGD